MSSDDLWYCLNVAYNGGGCSTFIGSLDSNNWTFCISFTIFIIYFIPHILNIIYLFKYIDHIKFISFYCSGEKLC